MHYDGMVQSSGGGLTESWPSSVAVYETRNGVVVRTRREGCDDMWRGRHCDADGMRCMEYVAGGCGPGSTGTRCMLHARPHNASVFLSFSSFCRYWPSRLRPTLACTLWNCC